MIRRALGSPALFAIVYSALAARSTSRSAWSPTTRSGLTPVVFLVAALFFVLTAMTYVEGASLHQERGGSTVFARYAFNELVELRRRLGDPARLRDPDRDHGVLGDQLPGRVLGALGRGALEIAVAIWRSSSTSRR